MGNNSRSEAETAIGKAFPSCYWGALAARMIFSRGGWLSWLEWRKKTPGLPWGVTRRWNVVGWWRESGAGGAASPNAPEAEEAEAGGEGERVGGLGHGRDGLAENFKGSEKSRG